MTKMLQSNLCYLFNKNKILLGLKKRGFGKGKWNGYGGKKEDGETIEEAVVREIYEEMNVKLTTNNLRKVAEIDFFYPEGKKVKGWDQTVHVFFADDWKGEPIETEEMEPRWFKIEDIPIDKMWVDDPHWLPHVLEGKKVKASFVFGKDGSHIVKKEVKFVDEF